MTFDEDVEENVELTEQELAALAKKAESRLKLWNKIVNGTADCKELMDEALSIGVITNEQFEDFKQIEKFHNECES